MKKIIVNSVFAALILTLCLSFNSCKKDDNDDNNGNSTTEFTPKQKIKKFYSEDEEGAHAGQKRLLREYTWNDNKIAKVIHHYEGSTETESYFYDDNNRLVKIESDQGYVYKIFSEGSKYNKIELYYEGELGGTYNISYNQDKISKITIVQTYDVEYSKINKNGFLSNIVSSEMLSKIVDKRINRTAKTGEIFTYTYTITFTYNGENIKEKVMEWISEYGSESSITRLTYKYDSYDNMSNPYYKLFIVDEDLNLEHSKNNPLNKKEILYFSNGEESHTEECNIKYSYKYANEYPIEENYTSAGDYHYEGGEKKYYEY